MFNDMFMLDIISYFDFTVILGDFLAVFTVFRVILILLGVNMTSLEVGCMPV